MKFWLRLAPLPAHQDVEQASLCKATKWACVEQQAELQRLQQERAAQEPVRLCSNACCVSCWVWLSLPLQRVCVIPPSKPVWILLTAVRSPAVEAPCNHANDS